MRGYNKAIIMGNLTRDPELRYTGSQRPVASFTVAVNRNYKDANGEFREDVAYIPVVVWGKSAEFCERNFRKGSGILVEGRINTRSYETKNGEKRYVTEIVADLLQFAGGRPREDDGSSSDDSSYGGSSYGGNRRDDYYRPSRSGGQAGAAPRSYRSQQSAPDDFPMDISEIGPGAAPVLPPDDEADIPF